MEADGGLGACYLEYSDIYGSGRFTGLNLHATGFDNVKDYTLRAHCTWSKIPENCLKGAAPDK